MSIASRCAGREERLVAICPDHDPGDDNRDNPGLVDDIRRDIRSVRGHERQHELDQVILGSAGQPGDRVAEHRTDGHARPRSRSRMTRPRPTG